jgi:lysophospholipase L1-like esterase
MKKIFLFLLLLIPFYSLKAQLNPCLEFSKYRILVLGSSTAAGAGVSTADSAWVNRYRNYLQSINPENEVINLAVGGYNSYRIMPDNFIPPPSRPLPDSLHNISKAISLNPDAIIINLPSNDVASGYSLAEQLNNLDSISSICKSLNIPLWITTTQARNMTIAKMQLQEDMKDSMIVHYSPHLIDFWTVFAMPDNSLNPLYDSGDGIHINDLGHGIMSQIIIDLNILDSLLSVADIADYKLAKISAHPNSLCGDSLEQIDFIIVNMGADYLLSSSLNIKIEVQSSGLNYFDTIQINNAINSCSSDTIVYHFSTYDKSTYHFSANVNCPSDTTHSNDSLSYSIKRIGHPTPVFLLNDTICNEGIANLYVGTEAQDYVFWYDSPFSNQAIDSSNAFTSPFLYNSENYYAEIVRGNRVFVDSLATIEESNVNWNGVMFDLVAQQAIIIDSLDVKINSLGLQIVEIYQSNGSHKGIENNPYAWTLVGKDTVIVNNSESFTTIDVGQIPLIIGDTVGIYIQMENSTSRLSYRTSGTENIFIDSMLTIITGSGISHNFSTVYHPRIWNGKIHYHFGYKPQGECVSGRYTLNALVNKANFSIGNDTIIDINDSLLLQGPDNFASYWWSTNHNQQNFLLHAADLGFGIHPIILWITDSLGCVFSDTILIGVANLASLSDSENKIKIYPNPFKQDIYIEGIAQLPQYLSLQNILGEEIDVQISQTNKLIQLHIQDNVSSGMYILIINKNKAEQSVHYLIKQ